jgi:hypothetical protein
VAIIARRNKFYLHYLHLQGGELLFWFLLLGIKTFGRLLVVDRRHLQSVKQFFKALPALQQAKAAFSDLQRQHGVSMSLRDIRKIILASLAGLPIRKF